MASAGTAGAPPPRPRWSSRERADPARPVPPVPCPPQPTATRCCTVATAAGSTTGTRTTRSAGTPWLADRFRGSTVTFWNLLAIAVASLVVLRAATSESIPLLAVSFTGLFVLTGIGNGSVYRMIPAVFHAESLTGGARTANQDRRLASALVGIAGAIGAFGGVLVQLAFRQSFLSYGDGTAAHVAFSLVCAAVTWAVDLIRG